MVRRGSCSRMIPVADRLARLRHLVGDDDIWEEPSPKFEPFLVPEPASEDNLDIDSDTGDVDKVLLYGQRSNTILANTSGEEKAHEPAESFSHSLQVGEELSTTGEFYTLHSLTRFPEDYIPIEDRTKISRIYFSKGKIFDRQWDLFYIYPPPSLSYRAILLVPLSQVKQFFATINTRFGTELSIPAASLTSGLVINFPMDGTPRPRFLGCSTDPKMAESLKQAVPSFTYRPFEPSSVDTPTDISLEAFKKKIALALENEKKKRTANKEKKKIDRHAKQQSWIASVKRVQRYLGLREVRTGHHEAIRNALLKEALEWKAYDDAVKAAASKLASAAQIFNDRPTPFDQESSVVFICVDVESFERNHNLVTEIGIATLDTADIASTPPGDSAKNWMKSIRAKHFRIKEYSHLVNREFIQGCPEHFQFGNSEWISIREAPYEVSKCFKDPFSATGAEPTSGHSGEVVNSSDKTEQTPKLAPKRNIILVGHDVKNDIDYLRRIGYDPHNLSNLKEVVDTSFMYRAFKREQQATNLGSILATLDIAGWYLHNAGNDAVYTLQAMLAIALRAIHDRQHRKARDEEIKIRISESVEAAMDNTWEIQQGWSTGGEDCDGGVPVSVSSLTEPSQSTKSFRNKSGSFDANQSTWGSEPTAVNSSWAQNGIPACDTEGMAGGTVRTQPWPSKYDQTENAVTFKGPHVKNRTAVDLGWGGSESGQPIWGDMQTQPRIDGIERNLKEITIANDDLSTEIAATNT